jgi:hypothetical protein
MRVAPRVPAALARAIASNDFIFFYVFLFFCLFCLFMSIFKVFCCCFGCFVERSILADTIAVFFFLSLAANVGKITE